MYYHPHEIPSLPTLHKLLEELLCGNDPQEYRIEYGCVASSSEVAAGAPTHTLVSESVEEPEAEPEAEPEPYFDDEEIILSRWTRGMKKKRSRKARKARK